ncbi:MULTISPECIES: hypothetical protein [unclassified Leisingera]|uniref:hypothetical protein n=1 Tax=unclassified Leisingera TaxID=2614906 RepID=UPI0002E81DD5|nr:MULTISPECIES: hypothetical protein [unclassified Leisingera]KIC23303.1 hypothetical protein RA23_14565 [Leisingera sp. ANG-S3]KIC49340.1 hypothetical protein RA22_21185 [Leisingera sp. ANG-S]KID08503.1 hypothetical protein GC1_15275 [Leisingera sp. ANG1]
MFIPVSGRIDPIRPNRGFLTARPVVRSDDPDKSETADNTPRGQDEHPQDAPHPENSELFWDAAGRETAAPGDELFHENAVLAEHLLMQRAWPADRIPPGGAQAAYQGYQEARTLTA